MAAKPYTAGHDALIRLAASECSKVYVFTSTADRVRKGEAHVLGKDMQKIWMDLVAPTLPPNVEVDFVVNPVSEVWSFLGDENENMASLSHERSHEFLVYGDVEDVAISFPMHSLQKYCGNLLDAGKVIPRAVERSETVDVSGTEMRTYLANGNKEAFLRGLPPTIDRRSVWDLLRGSLSEVPRPKTTAPKKRRSSTAR